MNIYICVCVFNENKWIYLFSLKLVFINILLYIEIYTFLKIFMSYRLLFLISMCFIVSITLRVLTSKAQVSQIHRARVTTGKYK